MMDLEKRNTTSNNNSVTPLSYNSINGNNKTSSVNLYSSNATSTNDIVEQSPESSKDVGSSKFVQKP